MSRQVSAGLKKGLLAGATEEGVIPLLTIEHATLAEPVRLSGDRVNTSSRGQTFIAFPFELDLPDDQERQAPRAELRVSNASREITQWLWEIPSAPTVTIELVRMDDPDTVEVAFDGLRMQEPVWNAAEISARLVGGDRGTRRFPNGRFDPTRFPGLF